MRRIFTPSRCLIRSSTRLQRIGPGPQLFVTRTYETEASSEAPPAASLDPTPFEIFKKSLQYKPRTLPYLYKPGQEITLHGFLIKRRHHGERLSFYNIQLANTIRSSVQIVSRWEEEGSAEHAAHIYLKSLPSYSPVCITADPISLNSNKTGYSRDIAVSKYTEAITRCELRLKEVQGLNIFPKDIIVSKDAVWPPKHRHLQMRFDPLLYERLRFRDNIAETLRQTLRHRTFIEVETPLLFKSTPEGAREFLVPTRREGHAYALPQSPQQYKQLLISGDVSRYFQFARCFRDEDHRADRQPEFTQVDLEMSFASQDTVMDMVNMMMLDVSTSLHKNYVPRNINGIQHPSRISMVSKDGPRYDIIKTPIGRIPYDISMTCYGTDKPDLRMQSPQVSRIIEVGHWLTPEFKSMISTLDDPIVEACKFRFSGSSQGSAQFIRDFFDTLPNTPHKLRGDNAPGVLVFDPSKPLNGLSSIGHDAAAKLVDLKAEGWDAAEPGDVIIAFARKNRPHQGGSTELGRLRKLIYDSAVEKGLLPKDHSLKFIWITEFPMFTPNDDGPGQGGSAGFSATHHPFTSPLSAADFELLLTDPLRAKAAHYDLVLNGVEIGGGSQRIHVAEVQEYVMRDVLKMTDEGVAQFSHLLEALRAGCPPHAGFAFGFDRFVSVLCGVPSVRDVIAFPKNNKGEDLLVGSPSKITQAERATYGSLADS
ncbi:putative aspartyl-tRNA synthetase [Rosellinia necatrix]|uniref:Putative aspartyl-tRNA synthetase n=1 Tax=Rosellinia necatrix TaxID=77044 RepID=A0A1S7UMI8_ROSNE|nr:putative aspartyl-tRNA synthetase [Rosellinia necatrix]